MSWRLWDSLQRDINKKSLPPEEAPDDSYIYRGLRPTEAEGRKHAPNNEFQTDQYGNVLDGEEPDCKLGYKFLSSEEREEEKRRMKSE